MRRALMVLAATPSVAIACMTAIVFFAMVILAIFAMIALFLCLLPIIVIIFGVLALLHWHDQRQFRRKVEARRKGNVR